MLFVNFLDKNDFGGTDGFLKVESTVGTFSERQEKDLPEFVEVDAEYLSEERKFIFSEAEDQSWGSNALMQNLFKCNDSKAKEINGIDRKIEEDMIVVTDKIRFIEGVKAYFKVLPLGDAMMICLYGGAAEFFVYGEWIPMNRSGKGIAVDGKRYEMSCSRLLDFLKLEDKESGYNIVKDGISTCEMYISESKQGTTNIKAKMIGSDFLMVSEDKLNKEREKARQAKLKKQAEIERKKKEVAEFEARRKELEAQRQAEENCTEKPKSASSKGTSTRRSSKKAPEGKEVDVTADSFMGMLKSLGYNG